MARKESKAARIRRLLAEGKRPSDIAAIVGCMTNYVQVVKQRDAGGGMRKCDRAEDPEARCARHRKRYHERYQNDPEFREKHRAAGRMSRQRQKEAKSAGMT